MTIAMSWDTEGRGGHADKKVLPDSLLFGCSPVMQELKARLLRVCASSVPLLLQGEAGVGKASLARFIHHRFSPTEGYYWAVNCSVLKDGWAPLAFSVALKGRTNHGGEGKLEQSSSAATLFLDRVCDLPALAQRGLAQLLDEQKAKWSGDGRRAPVRLIAATSRDLRQQVRMGLFRRDLFHQLAVVTIKVPALRQRREDLPAMCEHLRLRSCASLGVEDKSFPPEMMSRILQYHWPGNLSELENFIGRFVSLGAENCGPMETFPSQSSAHSENRVYDSTGSGSKWKN